MPYRPVDPALRETVEAAVDAAIASGKLSKSEIVASFADSGLNQATLFRWINQRATEHASGVRVSRRPPPKPLAEAVQEEMARGAKALAVIPSGGIPVMQLIEGNLEILQRGLAMAVGDDGKIKNPKLMLACVGEIGRHITHTARAQVAMSIDVSRRQDQFLEELLDIVMEALPEKRAEILGRMDALGLSYRAVA